MTQKNCFEQNSRLYHLNEIQNHIFFDKYDESEFNTHLNKLVIFSFSLFLEICENHDYYLSKLICLHDIIQYLYKLFKKFIFIYVYYYQRIT